MQAEEESLAPFELSFHRDSFLRVIVTWERNENVCQK